jgi:hypothetical protein
MNNYRPQATDCRNRIMSQRLFCVTVACLLCSSVFAQDRTLRLSNTSTTIKLLNGSTLDITPTTLTAKCVTNPSGTACEGIPVGGTPPTVVLNPSGFTSAPDQNNKYPAGTSFLITPSITGADVCVRRIVQGPINDNSGWTGPVEFPTASRVYVRSTGTIYKFALDCYNASGFKRSDPPVTVETNQQQQ